MEVNFWLCISELLALHTLAILKLGCACFDMFVFCVGKEEGFKQSIINYINHKCNSPELQTVLNNSSKTVGLLITERFVNIPPLLAPPMLKCLSKEIESAKQKKMPYNFSHLILVSKSYDVSSQGPNTTDGLPPCLEFINPEDEIFQGYFCKFCLFFVS